jgi:signal peptidase I
MAPTVRRDQRFLVDTLAYRTTAPSRGDIVVFVPPVPTRAPFFKRVIALPGDRVAIENGVLRINGIAQREPYVVEKTDYALVIANRHILVDGAPLGTNEADIPPASAWSAPDRLPAGCYLVLGDNRNDSEDGHVWGCTEFRGTFASGPRAGAPADLIGKVVHIY